MRPVSANHLTGTQFCGATGNTVLVAVATVRDIIAYVGRRMIPLRLLSLDFKKCFWLELSRVPFSNKPEIRHWRPLCHRHQADVCRCHIVCSNHWLNLRTHTNSLCGASGVSNEYGPLSFVSPSIFAPIGAKAIRYKGRTQLTSHIGCGLCRWREHFCDLCCRFHHYWRSNPHARSATGARLYPRKSKALA